MGISRRSGAWLGLILSSAAAANCGDSSDGNDPTAMAGQSSGGSAGSAGSGGTGAEAGTVTAAGGAAGEDAQGGAAASAGSDGDGGADVGAGGSPPVFVTSTKLDLLFVVDNSISMGDKQTLLAASIPALVERLVKPWCVGGAEPVPPALDGSCPANTAPEYSAVQDLHVGVITSSLGSSGGEVCADVGKDDHAHLVGEIRAGLTSWNDSGFLKWDPQAQADPPGASDASLLADDLAAMVVAAGDTGCGYEAPLEAMYRFLVDPQPPLTVVQDGSASVATGLDEALLAQRDAFVRPDSAIMIALISDENDCSIVDSGQGWLVGTSETSNVPFTMPRATAACASSPNSPCCRSCATNEVTPPDGCTALDTDVECAKGSYGDDDHLNLRCFEQKRRFGFDLLFPVERYVDGLSEPVIQDRDGEPVANPLFSGGRDPSLVMLTVIAGVPWQDLAVDPSPGADLDFLSTEQLTALSRWGVIAGDTAAHVPPGDPFMVESVVPRSGQNPVTLQSIVNAASTDPTATINGHETNIVRKNDLQYACIFPLPQTIDCSSALDDSCDCIGEDADYNRPLCQPPGGGAAGTTQYYGKAYPGLRMLDVARQLDEQSAVASICPRNSTDTSADDYGYYPALRALQKRLAPRLAP
jgi:hypothetical protein